MTEWYCLLGGHWVKSIIVRRLFSSWKYFQLIKWTYSSSRWLSQWSMISFCIYEGGGLLSSYLIEKRIGRNNLTCWRGRPQQNDPNPILNGTSLLALILQFSHIIKVLVSMMSLRYYLNFILVAVEIMASQHCVQWFPRSRAGTLQKRKQHVMPYNIISDFCTRYTRG